MCFEIKSDIKKYMPKNILRRKNIYEIIYVDIFLYREMGCEKFCIKRQIDL